MSPTRIWPSPPTGTKTITWFRVSGFGFRVSGFGLRGLGFGFRALSFGFRVSGSDFRVSGLWIRVQGYRSHTELPHHLEELEPGREREGECERETTGFRAEGPRRDTECAKNG